jgi:enamine deaminase RidA (YjgF/YER057c/UK114 family)
MERRDLVIPESIEEEIEQAFKNVERTLATAEHAGRMWSTSDSYHVGGIPSRDRRNNHQAVSPLHA